LQRGFFYWNGAGIAIFCKLTIGRASSFPEHKMIYRLLFLLSSQLFFTGNYAQQTARTENVILITLDGLRWQELFGGADSTLIADPTYVKDTTSLKKLFWRATPKERREVLMPFFWSTIVQQGQLYGNRWLNSYVNCSNTHWFSYPGYSEILCGFSDDGRIDSNDKINNPNITVLEFVNQQKGFVGSVAAFGSWKSLLASMTDSMQVKNH
jgi:hypothetical protein